MLTSSSHSQYLHPDYLQPLPTTLDAKKSPLALLAQTCSSIGKDTTPSKSLIPPLEKSSKDKSSRASPSQSKSGDDSSSSSDKARSKSPTTSDTKSRGGDDKVDGARSPGSDSSKSSFRAPAPKDIPPLVPIAHSPGSRKGSSTPEASSSSTKDRDRERDREKDNVSGGSASGGHSGGPGSSGRSSAGLNSNSRISLSCGNMLLEVNHQESASATAKLSASSSGLPTSASSVSGSSSMSATSSITTPSSSSMPLSATSSLSSSLLNSSGLPSPHPGMLPPGFSAYAGCLPLGLPGHPLDPASMHAHSAYSAAHSAMSAAAKHSALTGHAPYTYARVKTTSGATTLVPICRDPYCTNCQITMQQCALSSAGPTCAAGCTQCNHEKLPGTTPLPPSSVASALSAGGLAGMSALSGLGASASSLYPHAFGVLPGHHAMGYVCNWVAGADYCGKRFATSEELLQHLRTHTASSDTAASLAAMQAAYPGLPGLSMPSPLAAAACHSHYPPGSLSPNSIRQTYGRMSPNTLLAASRYHPYAKSPLSSLHATQPSLAGLQGTPSALGAYYSPYAALYGQRLGAVP